MPCPRQARSYTPFWPRLTWAVLVVALVGAPSLSWAQEEVKVSAAQMQTLGIRLVHPISSRTDLTLPYPTQIVIPMPQLWVVSTPVAGMVTSLAIARGDRVEPGQSLVNLESPSFVSLQREYLQAFSQEMLAAQQLKRNIELFDGRAVPQRVLETSQAEARQASIAVAEKRQMLRLSGLTDEATARLTNETAIVATMSVAARQQATVIDILVSPGQRVEQAAPLVKLARLSVLWAEIAIPASNIRAIRPGARVEIEGYSVAGQVILVSETTDAATQTVLVRAEVPNSGELRPGQTAAARIGFVSAGESAWEIPYSALVRRGDKASVFVANAGGFRLLPVTLVAEDQEHVVISGAISDTDEVAVSGTAALRGILLRLGASE
jgi:cobalt-zinc-cadmium efflux system membrane fusion protein